MFEWLSCGEWCDVRIICGPSVFNAHRTVLASSSAFLKNVLLSCPTESSPIFIFLPEIEAEVMLSVLYYIYNGEVSLPEAAIKKFIELISTLRIRIDDQSALLIKEKVGDFIDDYNLKFSVDNKDLHNDPQEKYFKIYKRLNIKQSSFYYKDSTTNCYKNIQLNNFDEDVCRPNNITDRQRQNYLHASFNEAYGRNGNVNGHARCVPAITNECYHTSLLINAEDDVVHSDNVSKEIILNKLSKETLYHEPERNEHNEIERDNTKQNRIMSHGNHLENKYVEKIFHETSPVNLRFKLNRKNGDVKYVYNKVLHNPWRSKLSTFYKPFRRNLVEEPENLVKNDFNENNNNTSNDFRLGNEKILSNVEENKTDICETDKIIPLKSKEPSTSIEENFQCSVCNEVFKDEISLTSHSKTHLSNGRYSCSECGKCFSQLRNFKYHISVHKGTKEYAATCTVCGKYFNDRGYLSSHMKIHRNRKEYKCASCPKSFNQRVAYNMHVRIHTGVKPHVCPECGKGFSRKMLLKQHQRTHSGERPYQCDHCDKRFADRSNMTLHLRLHTGVKPFSCSYCPKSFTKKHHLKSHLNFHTGDKPYSCPQCSMAFSQSSNMRTHLKKCSVNSKNKIKNCNGKIHK